MRDHPLYLLILFLFSMIFIIPAQAQSTYYEDLKVLCRTKSSPECCLASVKAMETGGFRQPAKDQAENEGCPEGTKRNMMRCIDSFQWCESSRAAEVNAAPPEHMKVYILDMIQQELESMRQDSPDRDVIEQAWKPFLKEEAKKLKRLYELLEQTPQDQLPKVMVSLFLEEDIVERSEYPNLDPYMIMLGDSVVPLLMGAYEEVPREMKEPIIRTLGAIGSRHALPTVRQALNSERQRLVMAAVLALRLILKEEAAPELVSLLQTSQDPILIKSLLRNLELLDEADWCSNFFDVWASQRLAFVDLFEIGDPNECSAKTLGEHVGLLLEVLERDEEASERVWVRELISRIRQPTSVQKLSYLLPQLVRERFRAEGVVRGYEKQAEISDQRLGFSDIQGDALLERMGEVLDEDALAALREPLPDLLPQLFLTDLIARKQGKRLDLTGKIFAFRIEAVDRSGELLAASDFRFTMGEERDIVLTSLGGGFPDHPIALKMVFDPETFMFHVEPLLIHLRPNGAQFSLDIPVNGIYEIDLLVQMRGEDIPVKWRFIHEK